MALSTKTLSGDLGNPGCPIFSKNPSQVTMARPTYCQNKNLLVLGHRHQCLRCQLAVFASSQFGDNLIPSESHFTCRLDIHLQIDGILSYLAQSLIVKISALVFIITASWFILSLVAVATSSARTSATKSRKGDPFHLRVDDLLFSVFRQPGLFRLFLQDSAMGDWLESTL